MIFSSHNKCSKQPFKHDYLQVEPSFIQVSGVARVCDPRPACNHKSLGLKGFCGGLYILMADKKTRIITPDATVCGPQLKRFGLLEDFASNIKPLMFGKVMTAFEWFLFRLSKEIYAVAMCNINPV